MSDRSKLKGGLKTRKTDNEYRKKYDAIRKPCGCVFGEKCTATCPNGK